MLGFGEANHAAAVSMDDGISRHHFRPEQRMFRQAPMEHAAVPVRPVHHGRDRKLVGKAGWHSQCQVRKCIYGLVPTSSGNKRCVYILGCNWIISRADPVYHLQPA